MNKAELDKKSLSDLHRLAAEAGVEKYRMLTKAELVERLASGNGDAAAKAPAAAQGERSGERPRRRRRGGRGGSSATSDSSGGGKPEREPRERPEKAPGRAPTPKAAAASTPEPAGASTAAGAPRPRRRRRRRFGRRGKQVVTLQGLLLPPEAGRQALVFAETREGCTTLLRTVAADLAADSKGPDPVALLIDPSPEELADWKRDAPRRRSSPLGSHATQVTPSPRQPPALGLEKT